MRERREKEMRGKETRGRKISGAKSPSDPDCAFRHRAANFQRKRKCDELREENRKVAGEKSSGKISEKD